MYIESEKIELKREYNDKLYNEVVAFANTEGGIVYVGVNDKGEVYNERNIKDEYDKIVMGIKEAIQPDVTGFVKYTLQEDGVIKIEISEGSNKPYFLKSKGLKPEGVYIREGSITVKASSEKIKSFIKSQNDERFETMVSKYQELHFESAKMYFDKNNVEWSENKFNILGIYDKKNDKYTNIGLIFSDECPYTIKVAVFSDEDNLSFSDSKEFTGSIFKQLEDAYDYILICNNKKSNIDSLVRVDEYDYPLDAIREALVNAVIHRDYGYSGSIIININKYQMEIISLGGLTNNLSIEDIKSGISQPRNVLISKDFKQLGLIESYGTGIRKIYTAYEKCNKKPEIITTQNTYKIILPNTNISKKASLKKVEKNKAKLKKEAKYKKIIDTINKKGDINVSVVMKELDVKKSRAYEIIKELKENKH